MVLRVGQIDTPPIVLGGFVAGPSLNGSFTITRPANTTAYAANQTLADSTTGPLPGGYILKNMARSPGGGGMLWSALVTASAGTVYQGEMWLFNMLPAAINDAATFSVPAAFLRSSLVGIIPFLTNDSGGTASVSYVNGLELVYQCAPQSADLYCLIKILNAPTPGSAEVLSFAVGAQN